MATPKPPCVGCRLPLGKDARDYVIRNRPRPPTEWYVCDACAQPAPVGQRPPGIGPPEPDERRLFSVPPTSPEGIVISLRPKANRAQVLAWDKHFVRTVVWSGTMDAVKVLWWGSFEDEIPKRLR